MVLNLQASWTEARQKLEKDPLSRACNPDIDTAEMERIFREHVDELYNVNISILSLQIKYYFFLIAKYGLVCETSYLQICMCVST